jgi:hypothetical protein
MKSAQLQKGLILVRDGVDLAEEGVGFGVPVSFHGGVPRFSGTATVSDPHQDEKGVTVKKTFAMDLVATRRAVVPFIGSWTPPEAVMRSWLSRQLGDAYRTSPWVRTIINRVHYIENASGLYERGFTSMDPAGEVEVTYHIRHRSIDVEMDLLRLRGWEKVSVMNELGASVFRKFSAPDVCLVDDSIGAWEEVTSDWGCFSDLDGGVSSKLGRTPGARLFRGRESVPGFLSWAGLSYEIDQPTRRFRYRLEFSIP